MSNERYTRLAKLGMKADVSPMNSVLNLLRADPTKASSEITRPRLGVDRFSLDNLSREIGQEIIDNDSIKQLLPDLELVETVMIGSVLSPNDYGDTDLTFTVDGDIFDSELSIQLLEPVKHYFKKNIRLDLQLEGILSDVLFKKGAFIKAVLPENILDSLINGKNTVSTEAYIDIHKRLVEGQIIGFLGPVKPGEISVSNEDYNNKLSVNPYAIASNLTITDNFNVLKAPIVNNKIRAKRISDKLKISSESTYSNFKETNKKFTPDEIQKLYEQARNGTEHTMVVESPDFQKRRSVGHPTEINIPMRAAIPVYEAGRPSEHLGYFLLVDRNGYFVNDDLNLDYYGELKSSWVNGKSRDNSSEIIRLTRDAMGANSEKTDYELEQHIDAYASIITATLNQSLANGLYDQDMDIGLSEELKRLMFFRAMKSKHTQLLYIPAELVTYIAFKYNERGVGESLLTRSKLISMMRSVLLFADTIGATRNATGRKRVNITLDPNDPDPEQTILGIQSLIMESAHRACPLAAPDPSQMMDSLLRSGFDFQIDTNGADYAQTKVEYDDYITQVQAGNQELQDRLQKIHVSGMGISPEKVDPLNSPDFATTAVQNDMVMSRRVREMQRTLCYHLSKHVQRYTRHSGILRGEMAKIITDNSTKLPKEYSNLTVDEVVDLFIESITLSLPSPDSNKTEEQTKLVEEFDRLYETCIEAYITTDLFDDELLGVPGAVDKVLANVKAYFKRQFLAKNNIMPELAVLTEMDKDKPAFDLLDYQNIQKETFGAAILEFIKKSTITRKVLAKEFKSVIESNEDGFDTDNSGSSDTGGFDNDTSDEFSFGNDDQVDIDIAEPENDTPNPDELQDVVGAAATDEQDKMVE